MWQLVCLKSEFLKELEFEKKRLALSQEPESNFQQVAEGFHSGSDEAMQEVLIDRLRQDLGEANVFDNIERN